MAKKKGLTEDQLLALAQVELENSMGRPGGDLSEERTLAYEYYLRKPFGNEQQGLSKVINPDVAEVIDGVMPSLLRMFTLQDNLLQFDPEGPGDEEAAEQQSDYVSHQFFKRNNAFEIMFFWFFDALVMKNGYVKCHWDESIRSKTEVYDNLTDDEVLALLEDEEIEVIEHEQRVEVIKTPEGEQVELPMHRVKYRSTTKRGYNKVEPVPPEEIRISKDCNSIDPSKANAVFHVRKVMRGDLIAMEFDAEKVAALPAEADDTKQGEDRERNDRTDDQGVSGSSNDPSRDLIELAEGYIKADMDGDGIPELKQVFIAGGQLLEYDDIDRQPFHCLASSPLPHKHFGESYAEKVMDSQLVSSTLVRQILDNLYHTNNPGHGVWEQGLSDTTMSDLLTRRVGSVTTFSRPVPESYAPMTVPFTAGESFPMLEYFDRQKRNRTGITADGEGMEPERLKHIQRSVMMTSFDQNKGKIEMLARIFAETGFKTLFLHMHENILKHQQVEEILKLRDKYVRVNPQEWSERYDMTVQIGLGIGTREQNLLHLEALFETQSMVIQGGGGNVLVTAQNRHNTLKEMVKNMNYKSPELFFSPPPEGAKIPAPSDEALALQKKEQELKERQQQLDMERQQAKSAELQLKAQKQEVDAQLKLLDLKEKTAAREDKFAAENEKLRNELYELRLDVEQQIEDRQMQQEKQAAEIEHIRAQAAESRARIAKIMEEVDAQNIENAAAESGIRELVEDLDGSESE